MTDTKWSYISSMSAYHPPYSTLPDLLLRQARNEPGKACCIHCFLDGSTETITNQQLYDQETKLAKHLVNTGIRRGDRVGILGPNSISWIIGEFAIIMAGALSVHMTIGRKDASDIIQLAKELMLKGVLIGNLEQEVTSTILTQLKDLEKFTILLQVTDGVNDSQCQSILQHILAQSELDVDLPTIYPEDPIIVFTTSGSTGNAI